MWVGMSVRLLPSEAHTNPLPLNQSPLPPSSLTLLSPDIEPHSPVCMLPHTVNWLTLTDSAPTKEKITGKNKGVALQKSLRATRKEGRINLPLSTAPMPPLQVELESPPPAPSSIECQGPSLPWFAIWELPPQQNHLTEGKRVGMSRIGWRKETKVLNNISVQSSNKIQKKKQRGCTTWTVWCGLPTRPHHCLPLQFVFFHLSYQFPQPCLLGWYQFMLRERKIIANRIKVAKYGYLHEMEPLCFIWR